MIGTWDINSTVKSNRLWDGALEEVFFPRRHFTNFWKSEQKSLSESDKEDDLHSDFEKISLWHPER